MSDFLKVVGGVILMLSTTTLLFLIFCGAIVRYFSWVFSFFPIETYFIPVILIHSFLFGGVVYIIGILGGKR